MTTGSDSPSVLIPAANETSSADYPRLTAQLAHLGCMKAQARLERAIHAIPCYTHHTFRLRQGHHGRCAAPAWCPCRRGHWYQERCRLTLHGTSSCDWVRYFTCRPHIFGTRLGGPIGHLTEARVLSSP